LAVPEKPYYRTNNDDYILRITGVMAV